ncbi:single-stranded DNA-binding protein [Telmatocola sphagniphila]|uniref:Single-stranded DNA-binding protein n=1 Tax=Telmatocola sphagniphila TaxID=1123043 RepID=A0A8E6B6S6_9BACT|nr:single-stranded DNA-binding protein [Telmatocola sphagniphila]QVL32504.1 single-stranded DNA-binding protein [Telmatocola sphagniphila]
MARFNKVILVGRLTREPECRTFSTGGKVAKFGFAVSNRKKNTQTGQWEDEPMFIDCEAFNRGEYGKLADTIEKFCHKGSQILVDGRLHLDTWDDKTSGQKRQKHKIVVEEIQLLDARQDGPGGGSAGGRSSGYSGGSVDNYDDSGPGASPASGGHGSDDIPF